MYNTRMNTGSYWLYVTAPSAPSAPRNNSWEALPDLQVSGLQDRASLTPQGRRAPADTELNWVRLASRLYSGCINNCQIFARFQAQKFSWCSANERAHFTLKPARLNLFCLFKKCPCHPLLNQLKTKEIDCAIAGGLVGLQMCPTHTCCQVPNAAQRPRVKSSPRIRFPSNLISVLVQRGFFFFGRSGCSLIPPPARAPAFDQLLLEESYRQTSSDAGGQPTESCRPLPPVCRPLLMRSEMRMEASNAEENGREKKKRCRSCNWF